MSKKNGDKARYGKEHKKKLLRRQRNLALRQSLIGGAPTPLLVAEIATPVLLNTAPGTATDAETKVMTDAIL